MGKGIYLAGDIDDIRIAFAFNFDFLGFDHNNKKKDISNCSKLVLTSTLLTVYGEILVTIFSDAIETMRELSISRVVFRAAPHNVGLHAVVSR